MSLHRVYMESPNQSGRGGAEVTRIVLHTAEGALSYQSLGDYFASPAAQVSSHVGIDDSPGVVGEYVDRGAKAWTAGDANPFSVQAELCAFAGWSRAEWDAHPTMIDNAGRWVAEEAAMFGIPLVEPRRRRRAGPRRLAAFANMPTSAGWAGVIGIAATGSL